MKRIMSAIIIMVIAITNLLAQEESTTFDSKGKIYKLLPNEANKIEMFKADGEFQYAEIFKISDSLYVVESHFSKNGKQFRDKKQLTSIQLNELRLKVDEIVSINDNIENDQEGRGFLLAASLISGITTYGPALTGAIDPSNSRAAIGLYMLGAGGLFFVPYFATKKSPVSYAQANLTYYGLSRGFVHGALFGAALSDNYELLNQQSLFAGIGFGLTEAFVGYHLINKYNISSGAANLITVYGDYGLYAGIATLVTIEEDVASDMQNFTGPLTAATSIASEFLGYKIAKKHPVSAGDAEIIYSTAMLGAFLPYTVVSAIGPKYLAWYTIPSIITGAAGIYAGHKLVKNVDFSFNKGFITKLGTVAGGITGLGLTYLLLGDINTWGYLAGAYIGDQTTFALMYSLDNAVFKKKALQGVGFRFTPQNIMIGQKVFKQNPYLQGMLPVVSCSYSF